ncbi:MAG: hypothetical protein HYW05_04220 [Candidatus Diapherotrites archaeon]|nr:hypothetical protein [Candidatus Diapherotrites archaeon]
MGKKLGALLLIAIIAVIAYFAFGKDIFGNIFGNSFEGGLAQIGGVDGKFGIEENMLMPANANETANYISELDSLKAQFENAPESREKSALLLLIGSRIYAADAQKSMIDGVEAYRRISKVKYECGEGETAGVAKIDFGKAAENAERALSLRGTFIENYPDFAETAGIGSTDISGLALKAIAESAGELVKNIEAYCSIQNA